MAAFADQVVVAIQNARLIDQLGRSQVEISRRADAERAVREIAANISALRDTEAILQQTVDEARRLLVSNSARIDMLDDDGTTLRWSFASGEDAIRTRDTGFDAAFQVGEGIAGLTVASGRAFRTGDYLVDDRFTHVPRSDALIQATGFRSVISAPLRGETGSLGAISVSSELPDHYDDNQAEILQGLADQAAIAIRNSRLIEALERSARSQPGSPRSGTRTSSCNTSPTRPSGSSIRKARSSTSWIRSVARPRSAMSPESIPTERTPGPAAGSARTSFAGHWPAGRPCTRLTTSTTADSPSTRRRRLSPAASACARSRSRRSSRSAARSARSPSSHPSRAASARTRRTSSARSPTRRRSQCSTPA
ncbi:MAG: GAF domain-containing protein [Candidatus Eisenbacteria bacterium]|uniref:GAF domain-containing protein n=1 Tax=Eiseniibacteriota bacterium TaxID=2212470 RepID=A0A538TZK3_UNCEI|nr:MAG: GAF domain-containing protein [Candidatus Eisenbacteria bacterium]